MADPMDGIRTLSRSENVWFSAEGCLSGKKPCVAPVCSSSASRPLQPPDAVSMSPAVAAPASHPPPRGPRSPIPKPATGARKNGKTSLFSGFGRSKQTSLPSRPGPLFAGDSWGSHPFSGMNSCVECGGCGEPAMPIMTGCGECSTCAPMPDCSSPMMTGCHAPTCAQPVMQPDCHAPTCAQPFVQPDCHAPTCAQPMVAPDCHAPHIMIGPGPDCSGPLATPSCVAPPMPGCAMPAPGDSGPGS